MNETPASERPIRWRGLATNHPHVFYWWGALEAVFFAVIGAVLMPKTVGGGIVVVVVGLVCGTATAIPGIWSERHPEQARTAVQQQKDRTRRLARKHPAYFLVLLPIIAALDASLRWNRNNHHHSTTGWLIPAACGLVFGLILGVVLVRKARRSQASASVSPT